MEIYDDLFIFSFLPIMQQYTKYWWEVDLTL